MAAFILLAVFIQLFIQGKIFSKTNYYKFGFLFILISFFAGVTLLITAIIFT